MGIVHGDAPPFIMLTLSWTIAVTVLGWVSYNAAQRPALVRLASGWAASYLACSFVLICLLLVRIGARAALDPGDGESFFWGLDVLILGLTSYGFSAPWVLSVLTWTYAQETKNIPEVDTAVE